MGPGFHAVNLRDFRDRFSAMLDEVREMRANARGVCNPISDGYIHIHTHARARARGAVNGIARISATHELSSRVESLLEKGERAHKLGLELSRETDGIRRDLEGAVRACSGPDRSLCAVIDSSGIRLDLRIERVNKLYD